MVILSVLYSTCVQYLVDCGRLVCFLSHMYWNILPQALLYVFVCQRPILSVCC